MKAHWWKTAGGKAVIITGCFGVMVVGGCSGQNGPSGHQTAEAICAGYRGWPGFGPDFYVNDTLAPTQDPILKAAGYTGQCMEAGEAGLGLTAYVLIDKTSAGTSVRAGDCRELSQENTDCAFTLAEVQAEQARILADAIAPYSPDLAILTATRASTTCAPDECTHNRSYSDGQ